MNLRKMMQMADYLLSLLPFVTDYFSSTFKFSFLRIYYRLPAATSYSSFAFAFAFAFTDFHLLHNGLPTTNCHFLLLLCLSLCLCLNRLPTTNCHCLLFLRLRLKHPCLQA